MEEMETAKPSTVEDKGFATIWGPVFVGSAIGVSLVLHLLVAVPLGFSASSDAVFGLEALLSGIVADQVLRRKLEVRLTVKGKGAGILWIWVPLCLFVMATRPFE